MAAYNVRRSGLLGDFSQSVLKNSGKVLDQVNSKVYEISKELFLSIVDLTPSPAHPGVTAKGLLVNNWFPVEGNKFSEDITTETSPYGASSITRIKNLRGNVFRGKDGVVTISNNISYAYRAEVLGWPASEGGKPTTWSGRVGPYRMVALSLQRTAARYK